MKHWVFALLTGCIGAPAWAQSPGDGWHAHMMYGGGYGVMGYILMLLFWAGIAVLVVLTWRSIGQNGPSGRADSALDILRQRLAKGEIEPEEYEARRKVLEG